MDCETASALIAREVDAGLDAEERRELAAHAERCPRCAEALQAHAAVASLLRSRPEAPLPAGFDARLRARLDAEQAASVVPAVDWRRWTARALPIAALLLLATGLAERSDGRDADVPTALEAWTAPAGDVTAGLVSAETDQDGALELILARDEAEGGDGR